MRNGFYSDHFDGCNKENFVKFLTGLSEARTDKQKELVVILDSHKSHHAVEVLRKAEELNIAFEFLPTATSDFMSAEKVFGILKRRVQLLITDKSFAELQKMKVEEYREVVKEAVNSLTVEEATRIWASNQQVLHKFLVSGEERKVPWDLNHNVGENVFKHMPHKKFGSMLDALAE